jgi:hypothetical protein
MRKILQIIPADPNIRAAFFDEEFPEGLLLTKMACMGLIEEGTSQEIVYFELVDNSISEFYPDYANNFIGFVDVTVPGDLHEAKEAARQAIAIKRERNGQSV